MYTDLPKVAYAYIFLPYQKLHKLYCTSVRRNDDDHCADAG